MLGSGTVCAGVLLSLSGAGELLEPLVWAGLPLVLFFGPRARGFGGVLCLGIVVPGCWRFIARFRKGGDGVPLGDALCGAVGQ